MSDNTDNSNVDLFESQLKRFKKLLSLREDQEVARVLGMTKAAFSYRKRTGSFPEERLITLKAKIPDLDVQYILFGESWASPDRESHDDFLRGAAALGWSGTDLARAIAEKVKPQMRLTSAALENTRVRSLLEALEWCDDDSIDLLVRLAAKLRGPKAVPLDTRQTFGLTMQHEAGAGKVDSVLRLLLSLPLETRILVFAAVEDSNRSQLGAPQTPEGALDGAAQLDSPPGIAAKPNATSRKSKRKSAGAKRTTTKPAEA